MRIQYAYRGKGLRLLGRSKDGPGQDIGKIRTVSKANKLTYNVLSDLVRGPPGRKYKQIKGYQRLNILKYGL